MLRKLTELETEHVLEKALEQYECITVTDFQQALRVMETTMEGDSSRSYVPATPVHLSIVAIAYPKRKRKWSVEEEMNRAGTKVKWYRVTNAYGGLIAKFKDGETAEVIVAAHNSTVPEND